MNKIVPILALCLCALPLHYTYASVQFLDADLSTVSAKAAREGKLYFVHFTAGWCMPCQWMEKNTFTDEALSNYTNKNYLAVKLDIDQSEGLHYKQQFKITILPSILIFNAQGVMVDRIEESLDAMRFQERLQTNDSPGNRISGQQASGKLVSDIMLSPKPILQLSRPALVPDGQSNIVKYEALVPSPIVTPSAAESTTAAVSFVHQPPIPIKLSKPNWAPRSDKGFGIQVGVFSEYSNAIKEVRRLEEKFEVPVNLYAQKKSERMTYKVVVGLFSSHAKAIQYLNYLNRNDLEGFVRDLAEF
ncbi:MAG: hypothetical protein DHS20C18_13620 [Saprospiraceae bacterium]|nr:MAG: hypothetical protein DHS20C18_13620 [Saprospiraceae bacterium]